MNKNIIIAIVAAVVVAGGYYQFSYKPAQEAAAMAQIPLAGTSWYPGKGGF